MAQNNKVVLLFSGGIDSTVLLYWLIEEKYKLYPLIINYGQVTFEGEYIAATKILDRLKISNLFTIDISEISKIGKGALLGQYPKDVVSYRDWHNAEFFPNRNLMLMTIATNYAYKINASNIAIGVVGDSYRDTSMDFLNSFKKCIGISLMSVNVIAPFVEKARESVIKESIRLGVPIENTYSCNALGDRHCLLCSSCYEREMALSFKEQID